jgi:tetratricopeptide (TPR) repeat protein
MKRFVVLLFLFATPAMGACPPAPDISVAEGQLLSQVKVAPNERAARVISNQLWELWATAPDAEAQKLLDRGMAARSGYDFASALDAFDALTEYCPDYAEGYNQRAFVNFLKEDYETALIDLDLAIDRSPRHVAAIAGKALTLIGLKRDEDAQRVLREALALNPWLSERQYLTDPDGRDL